MYNTIEWKRSKQDGCSILTSDCGIYEIVQSYEGEGYYLNKNGYSHNGVYNVDRTQSDCKESAEWDKRHN
jgi:hypothetical protein